MKLILAILLVGLSLCSAEQKKSFVGYKVLALFPQTEDHLKIISEWSNNDNEFDMWNEMRGLDKPVTVSLSPKSFLIYKKKMSLVKLPFKVIESNLQNLIKVQDEIASKRPKTNSIVGRYVRYNELINFADEVVAQNPDIASQYNPGKTIEGRDIRVVVLKTATSKRSIWIDCGIHAREWAAIASCPWFIDSLIKGYRNNDPDAVNLLNYYEFHVLSLINPDGYEFTHNSNRLWRKNRRRNSGSACIGTDPNRNFPYQWMVAGASNIACSDAYAGPAPGSEEESKAVINSINAKSGNWDAFFTIHAYGNFWMFPWSYTKQLPPDYDEFVRISAVAVEAIKKVDGTVYFAAAPANNEILGAVGGGSFDWTYADAKIKYSFGLEVRPGHYNTDPDDKFGFLLPEDRAPVVGQEVYAGITATVKDIKRVTGN